jgi:hypothetical protein
MLSTEKYLTPSQRLLISRNPRQNLHKTETAKEEIQDCQSCIAWDIVGSYHDSGPGTTGTENGNQRKTGYQERN